METKTLRLESIRTDGGSQMRDKINADTVAEYLSTLNAGALFDPLEVMFDGEAYWLWDGFHRLSMYRDAGHGEVLCRVTAGTLRDARIAAAAANQRHGLRRDYAAKRASVLVLLRDEEWAKKGNVEIGRHVGVSHDFVRKVRSELSYAQRKIEGNPDGQLVGIPEGVTPHEKLPNLTPHPGFSCYDDDRGEWYSVRGYVVERGVEFDEDGNQTKDGELFEFRRYVSDPDNEVEMPMVKRGKEKEQEYRTVRRGDQEYQIKVSNIGKGKKKKEEIPLEVIENNSTKPLSAKALGAVLSDWLEDRRNQLGSLTALIEGNDEAIEDVKSYLSGTRKIVFGWPDVVQAATELRKQYVGRPQTDEDSPEAEPELADPIVLTIPFETADAAVGQMVAWLADHDHAISAKNLEAAWLRAVKIFTGPEQDT
jgi:hypothetical protein